MGNGRNSFDKGGHNYRYGNITAKRNDNIGLYLIDKFKSFEKWNNNFGDILNCRPEIFTIKFAGIKVVKWHF